MRPALLAALAASLLSLAHPARANEGVEDIDIAKSHYSTGQDYFAASRYGSAGKEFL